MKDYVPNPADYTMKGTSEKPREMPAEEFDLGSLTKLSKPELIALCERMARQCGMVASMSEEETAQAMMDTLAATALRPITAGINIRADIQSRLSAIDKWLDRTRGKPLQMQAIALKSEHTEIVNISDPDSLLDMARRMEFIMAKARTLDMVQAQPVREAISGNAVEVIDKP